MISLAPPLPRAAQRCSSIPENSEPHRPPLFCPKGVGEMAADDYKGEQQEGEHLLGRRRRRWRRRRWRRWKARGRRAPAGFLSVSSTTWSHRAGKRNQRRSIISPHFGAFLIRDARDVREVLLGWDSVGCQRLLTSGATINSQCLLTSGRTTVNAWQ